MKNNYEHLEHLPSSIEYLAKNLNDGNVVLFLGAGASAGFGLPDWQRLINDIRRKVSLSELTDSNCSTKVLQHAADDVLEKLDHKTEVLIKYIEESLYVGFDNLSIVNSLDNHLLVAISALIMGGKRGRVTRVITLNYDSMLEWFLSLFGFVVKTIHTLPELEGSEDVRIYHPHGFVPIPNQGMKSSDFVILGMESVYKRIGTLGDPWFEMTRHLLNTGLCLFIGMSENTLDDPAIATLLSICGKSCSEVRPLGFWMLGHKVEDDTKKIFFRHNIIPIILDGHKEYPKYLLDICQAARNALNK